MESNSRNIFGALLIFVIVYISTVALTNNYSRTESYFVINLPILDIDNKKLQKPPPVFTTSKTSNLTSTAKPEIERKTNAVSTTTPVSKKPEKLLPKDLCSDFQCKNGGSCNVENETPKCTCLIDFAGDNCEKLNTNVQNDPKEEAEYAKILSTDYTKTPLARANPSARVRSFTGAWPIPSEMPVSLRRDTACPMTPKDRFKKNLEYRWPDAIGIGFPKCGTGTLGFIDCSSKLVFREAEPYYWNNAKRLSEGFTSYALPKAAKDEILIEKTPDYSLGSQETLKTRAQRMKEKMPNLKLIVLMCDPATRSFSHIKHQANGGSFIKQWAGVKNAEPMKALGKLADWMNNTGPYLSVMRDIEQYGNYWTQLQPYFEVFGKDKFHFVDGGAIVKNPTPEFSKIEEFFGLENELEFRFNRTKGFPCLHRPVPYCLSAAKGRTRGTNTVKLHPDEAVPEKMASIRYHYKSEMRKIFDLVHPNLSLEEFCEEPDLFRFAWLEKFLCKPVQR